MAGNQGKTEIPGEMTVESRIVRALEVFGDPVENAVHTSDEERYYVFYVSRFGTLYADDEPNAEAVNVQIHLFAPLAENIVGYIKDTKKALRDAGFLWPKAIDASDQDGRHIVFETEWVEGL